MYILTVQRDAKNPWQSPFKDLLRWRANFKMSRRNERFLLSSTIALHVRHKFWYISLAFPAKQQTAVTKFKVLWRKRTQDDG